MKKQFDTWNNKYSTWFFRAAIRNNFRECAYIMFNFRDCFSQSLTYRMLKFVLRWFAPDDMRPVVDATVFPTLCNKYKVDFAVAAYLQSLFFKYNKQLVSDYQKLV